jgi:azurin
MMSDECVRSQDLRVVKHRSQLLGACERGSITIGADQNAIGGRVLIDLSALGVTMKKVRSLIW